ncbi:MAG: YbaY family lipoprotein [Xanthomonadales bacterium]|nr:YbaY family lipoprotein [Xanthomonadales bacterium]
MHSRQQHDAAASRPARSGPALLAAATLLLCACQSAPPRPAAPLAGSATSGRVSLQGRAFPVGVQALPPGCSLDVHLIRDAAGEDPLTLASGSFAAAGTPPFEFSLPYDSARITVGSGYSLRAVIRDARGHLLLYTARRVPVDDPGDPGTIDLPLVRYAGP